MSQPAVLIERCEKLARGREREDLLRRLGATRERWATSDVRVLVVGEIKQGKSQLVNALVGAPVCPVSDDIATSVPLTVRHGDTPRASLLRVEAGSISEGEPIREAVEIQTLAARLTAEPEAQGGAARLVAAEAELPRQLLSGGLVLVDTPGVGGWESAHGAATRATLPSAHAILFVTDTSQELTAPEVDFIRQARAACPNVALVMTKTDLHPQWRRVKELNAARLEAAGLKLPQVAVSSDLRLAAARTKDAELNEESGFPRLISFLQTSVLARRDDLARRSVRHDLTVVLDELSSSLDSERRVLTDAAHLPEVMAELTKARARAEELKQRSAKWQQTLNDGVADLNADLDHDLRDRMRTVQAEADRAIEEGDPGHDWPSFVSWLEDATAQALADTFTWAEQSAGWLVDRVGEHFEEAHDGARLTIEVADTSSLQDRVGPLGDFDAKMPSLGTKFIVGMKGSYGGVLMFGILTSLAGMALINPISIGAGILLGGRAFREDAENRLNRRRNEAHALVRRQLDETVFQSAKILRDRLRLVQREVRDHYAERAEDLSRSISESLSRAQSAATADERERKSRLAAITTDRAAIDALRAEVATMGTSASGSAA